MCKFSYCHIDDSSQCVIVRLCSCKVTHSFLISVYSFSFLFHLCCKKLHSWEIKVKFASKFSRIFIEHLSLIHI